MSHTTKLPDGYIAIHDGDLGSCDKVLLRNPVTGSEMLVPMKVLYFLVGLSIQYQKIAEIERMSTEEDLFRSFKIEGDIFKVLGHVAD